MMRFAKNFPKTVLNAISTLPEAGKIFLSHYELDIPKSEVHFESEKETAIALSRVIIKNSSLGTAYDFRRYLTHSLALRPELLDNLEALYQGKGKALRSQVSLMQSELAFLQKKILRLEPFDLPPVADDLPAAATCFVGREAALNELKANFTPSGLVVLAIQGIAGSGKSQLAAEYAHQNSEEETPYRLIRWLKADTEENLKNAYFGLGDALGLERKAFKDSEEAFKNAINRQLLRYERILLIYDNVESLDYIEKYKPSAGGNTTVHILMSSRHRFIEFPSIEVKEFNDTDIETYLKKKLNRPVNQAEAKALGKELGYLPLAIVQAAAYMNQHAKPLDQFIKLLQIETSRRKVLETTNLKLNAVSTLWNITLEKLSSQL